MNILFTSVGDFQSLEAQECIREWKARYHAVEAMPMDRVSSYLRLDPASTLALVDVIVCMADTDHIIYAGFQHHPTLDFPLEKALELANDVRNVPETCTMHDGRKWRSIPFAIFCDSWTSGTVLLKQRQSHARVYAGNHPVVILSGSTCSRSPHNA
jgi:hypothetical protein